MSCKNYSGNDDIQADNIMLGLVVSVTDKVGNDC